MPKNFSECLESNPNAESIKKWAEFFQLFGRIALVLCLVCGCFIAHVLRKWYICVGTILIGAAIFVSYKFMHTMLIAASDLVESSSTTQKALLYKMQQDYKHRHKSAKKEIEEVIEVPTTEINIIAPDMEVCPYCKETQIEGRKFCIHCGATLR